MVIDINFRSVNQSFRSNMRISLSLSLPLLPSSCSYLVQHHHDHFRPAHFSATLAQSIDASQLLQSPASTNIITQYWKLAFLILETHVSFPFLSSCPRIRVSLTFPSISVSGTVRKRWVLIFYCGGSRMDLSIPTCKLFPGMFLQSKSQLLPEIMF